MLSNDIVPHEIHLTVSSDYDVADFKRRCVEIGVKPILLVLHTATSKAKDMMTSKTLNVSTAEAFEAMELQAYKLKDMGYKVIRSKIEVAPWHPLVPTLANGLKHESGNYFESHLEVQVHNKKGSPQNIVNLKTKLARAELGVHVSANYFKALDEFSTVMVTTRGTEATREDFERRVTNVRDTIMGIGYGTERRIEVEYAIYDTNQDHDKEWMRGKR